MQKNIGNFLFGQKLLQSNNQPDTFKFRGKMQNLSFHS